MKEAYVSYEVAKLLREKGFDWEVRTYYNEDGDELRLHDDFSDMSNSEIDTCDPDYIDYLDIYCTRPTQQMAMRWLRKEHGLFIEIMCGEDVGNVWYDYDILPVGKDSPIIPESDGIITYEEPEDAIEAALEYCLTKLI